MPRKDSKGRTLKKGETERSDGRYQFRYLSDGNYKSIYSWRLLPSDRMPASKTFDLSLREKEELINNTPVLPEKSGIGISGYDQVINYLKTKVSLAYTTYNDYMDFAERILRNTPLGEKDISDIKKTDVLTFYADLSKKGYANGTLQRYQNILYPSFELAIDDELIKQNPCRNCMKGYRNDNTSREALTVDQQSAMLEFVDGHNIYGRYYPMLVFMLETCMRAGEVIGFTNNDIHESAGMLDINHQFLYKKKELNGGIVWHAVPPKWNSYRKVPITEKIEKAIWLQKRWVEVNNCANIMVVDGYKDILFPSLKCRPTRPNTLNRAIKNIIYAYNRHEHKLALSEEREPVLLPNVSVHTLRHTGCTRYAEMGMDPKVLQKLMGHKNFQTTMNIYNHVYEKRMLVEMQRVMETSI